MNRHRFLQAVCEGDLNEIKLVLDEGFDLDATFERKYGYTPMSLAAALNRPEVIEYLLLRGANINAFDQTGASPLMQAVSNFNFDCFFYEFIKNQLNFRYQYVD